MIRSMTVPQYFCWSRFGTESGEAIDQIIERKERERLLNGGIFLWGIGSALGPSVRELVKKERVPAVVFSPIKSKPKTVDVDPPQVVRWLAGETLNGDPYTLPEHSLVTSRLNSTGRHYALVCASDKPLSIEDGGDQFSITQLRNLRTNRPIGASQVTAVVSKIGRFKRRTSSYPVAMLARLVFPYFVRLTDPTPL